MFKKISSFFMIIIFSSFFLFGCFKVEQKPIVNNNGNTNDESQKDDGEETVDKEDNSNSQDNSNNGNNSNNGGASNGKPEIEKALEKYFIENSSFFINNNKKITYNGYAETGYTLENKKINKKDFIISYDGRMCDGYGEDERGPRKFSLTYNFKLDEGGTPMAYERIRNYDYMSSKKDSLNSIIKNYIVLWGSIKEGNSWEQKVVYKGKEYKAKTIMKNVNEEKYTLETTINNIDGFYKNTYKEERTYQKGKGLIAFSNSPEYDKDSGDGSDLLYGYTLTEL